MPCGHFEGLLGNCDNTKDHSRSGTGTAPRLETGELMGDSYVRNLHLGTSPDSPKLARRAVPVSRMKAER